jgi:NADH-quinone oxidoreductase subunit J
MVNILFYVFAALILVAGLLAITRKEPVHCALWLVVSLFGIASLYVLMNAEFLFAVQIFIYAGGIMVLYLFVIFLVEPESNEEVAHEPRLHRMVGPPIVVIFSPVLIYLLMAFPMGPERESKVPAGDTALTLEQVMELGPREASDPEMRRRAKMSGEARLEDIGNTKVLGLQLFTRYLFPFEIISVVLLVAMLGAIVLGRRRFTSYTEEEEAEMLAGAHYQGRLVAPPSGEPREQILAELKEEDAQQAGRTFRVFPDYEQE